MKISKEEFEDGDMPITLIGMSGMGKTYISMVLSEQGWKHYSCDYEIGTKYLSENIQKTLNINEKITVDNLGYLSQFIGKLGDQSLQGLPLDEFLRRQQLYYNAECQTVRDSIQLLEEHQKAVIDSSGSLCEILDEELIDELGQKSLFIYLEASEDDKVKLMRRAQEKPKPLFFPPNKFQEWLQDYLRSVNLSSPDEMNPNDFSRWIFPKLLASRLPKYQRLSDKYGVTIPASRFENLSSMQKFKDIVAEHLE